MKHKVVECCRELQDEIKSGQIEVGENRIHVNGCCGEGCHVISNCKFCPFCGAIIITAEVAADEAREVTK